MKALNTTLRITAILLMGITAVVTLAGGAGTTCVALAAESFGEKMALIAPYQWLYILFVLTTIAAGVLGVRAVIMLIRSRTGAYRAAMTALVSGLVVGVIHIVASRSIRGASMPVDMVVYVTLVTFLYFLILRIPAIWNKINFDKASSDKNLPRNAAAIMLGVTGLAVLTVQIWAGPTHMLDGVNYADAWHVQLEIIGWGMILLGVVLLSLPAWRILTVKIPQAQFGSLPE